MKLNVQQALFLFQILRDSVGLEVGSINTNTFNYESRKKLYEEIMNQQSTELKDLDE